MFSTTRKGDFQPWKMPYIFMVVFGELFPSFFFFFFSIPHPFLIMTIIFFSISIIYRPTPLEAKPTLAFSHHK